MLVYRQLFHCVVLLYNTCMKTILHKSETRGLTSAGWLVGRHSFSFNQWYHPERVQFGVLRVLNDDLIMPGEGFPPHSHRDMEIVTIPLKGAVAHEDSSGGKGTVQAGEVQIMSAGTGVTHSEYNASKENPLELLQIWILPEQQGLPPRYEEKKFDVTERTGAWQVLVSPDEEAGSLKIFQQAWFSIADIETNASLAYTLHNESSLVYLFVISGQVQVGAELLSHRDALGIEEATSFTGEAKQPATVLAIEVPV